MYSSYQQGIVNKLSQGYLIKTTEGANYKAWLESPTGVKSSVRVDTVNILFSRGILQDVPNTRLATFKLKQKKK